MLVGVTGVALTGTTSGVTVTGLYVGWMAWNPLIIGGFDSCGI